MGSARFNATAYKTGGQVWSWGCSSYGQLGNLSTSSFSSPVAVVGSHSFADVETGLSNGYGIKQDGSIWTWGEGTYGNLGDGTNVSKSSPVAVIGGHTFIGGSVGARNIIALKSNGEAWAWGDNNLGGLGNLSVTSYSSPVAVVGNHSFIKVRAGGTTASTTSGGLKSNGELWLWGGNAYGQCGDNTRTNKSSPVLVTGGHNFVDFEIATYSVHALKNDGSVWCWGANSYGELGNLSTTSYSSPVAVVGSHSFTTLTCTARNTQLITVAALKANGEAWTWGNGVALGDNSTTSKSSPVLVTGNHNFMQIKGGADPWLMGLKADGSVWTWGGNTFGQLGDLTTSAKSSPVAVVGNHSFISLSGGISANLNVGGNWIIHPTPWVNVGGTWRRISKIDVNVSGTWKRISRL
jgi:alpha-tubulin suppressor-like RCC1 family protein